jgi:hypothetical protein
MKTLEIIRTTRKGADHPTAGTIALLDDFPFAVTYELPWKDNQHDVSCIPDGEYICDPVFWGEYGFWTWHIPVEGRSGVLIHGGYVSRGCICCGEEFSKLNGPYSIEDNHGFTELLTLVNPKIDEAFKLLIRWGNQ